MSLEPGTAEAKLRLSTADSEDATRLSHMVELMELAALRLMKPRLREGECSTSISMNVTYAARTVVGGAVRAVAGYAGVSGRLHRFTVHVFDESGLIGSCEHTRAVALERRLLAMARRRGGRPSLRLSV